MAKKLRKIRTTPGRLFLLLLAPWLVMAAIATVMIATGAPDYIAILVALAGSLVATYLIRMHEARRKRVG